MIIPRTPRLFATALLGLIVLAGCVDINRPGASACAAPAITIELRLTDSGLTPDDPAVCRGQQVTLRVESETDGVFHIHGYDDEVSATSLAAGETVELSFAASRSGQFPIELHTSEVPGGIGVGVFTVHEP